MNDELVSLGVAEIEWAKKDMPVVSQIQREFTDKKPFANNVIAGCLHITKETANLAIALQAGGAEVVLCGSNPLSTKDSIVEALRNKYNIVVNAKYGCNKDEYYAYIDATLGRRPNFTIDDGCDLITALHTTHKHLIDSVVGGTEETTTGINRLKSMVSEGSLQYPVIAVNNANTKHLFDNRYGTGQSTIDGITRATNILWAGRTVVVAGYGWCGRGIAMRARGMGANVIVTEINPVRALEAHMDGFSVMPMVAAAKIGDVFITATGDKDVISKMALQNIKSGAILANSGHFNVEIDVEFLENNCFDKKQLSEHVVAYYRENHAVWCYVLCEGRLVNLAAAMGHPSEVMDMSFANQALCLAYLANPDEKLENKVYPVPRRIDNRVAYMKLDKSGIFIDKLTDAQKLYLRSWREGT